MGCGVSKEKVLAMEQTWQERAQDQRSILMKSFEEQRQQLSEQFEAQLEEKEFSVETLLEEVREEREKKQALQEQLEKVLQQLFKAAEREREMEETLKEEELQKLHDMEQKREEIEELQRSLDRTSGESRRMSLELTSDLDQQRMHMRSAQEQLAKTAGELEQAQQEIAAAHQEIDSARVQLRELEAVHRAVMSALSENGVDDGGDSGTVSPAFPESFRAGASSREGQHREGAASKESMSEDPPIELPENVQAAIDGVHAQRRTLQSHKNALHATQVIFSFLAFMSPLLQSEFRHRLHFLHFLTCR
jgi:hypothetical protein